MPLDIRLARQSSIRVLILLLGLCIGSVVYSYGMFHKFVPTWSDIATVANCGIVPSADTESSKRARAEDGSSFFCQVTPGKWIKTPYGSSPLFLALGVAFISALVALHRTSFLKWATGTATGVVTLFLLLFGIPMMLLGLQLNFIEGTLTPDGVLHIGIYAALGGSIMGLLAWHIVVKNLRANRRTA